MQTRLILPLGGFLFDGWLSKDRRVFGVACEGLVVIGLYSSTADVARPSALREASLKDQPPSSLDCSSCWCCSLFRPALRKDVCRVERPFARTLNGIHCAAPNRSGRPPARVGSDTGRAGDASPSRVRRTWVAPSGLLLLAEQAYAPRPSPTATTVFVYRVFRQRFAHLHSSERKTSFSGLWRDTAGGSCVGDPVLPRPLPYFIQLFLLRLKRCAHDPSRRGDSSCLRRPFDALGCYITTDVAGMSN